MVYLTGGMAHQDTFDLKPDAPDEIRGEFKPISTVVPGLQVGELLPKMATVMDRVGAGAFDRRLARRAFELPESHRLYDGDGPARGTPELWIGDCAAWPDRSIPWFRRSSICSPRCSIALTTAPARACSDTRLPARRPMARTWPA